MTHNIYVVISKYFKWFIGTQEQNASHSLHYKYINWKKMILWSKQVIFNTMRQSYLFLRRDVRLSEFNWCIKVSLNVGSIDSTVIKRKKYKKKTKICQHKKNHKSIPYSLSITATALVLFAQQAKLGGQATQEVLEVLRSAITCLPLTILGTMMPLCGYIAFLSLSADMCSHPACLHKHAFNSAEENLVKIYTAAFLQMGRKIWLF